MITLANDSMQPGLIHLWQQSFGDSIEYIKMFLDWNFSKIKTVVYVADHQPVSVAYLMPVTFVEAGGTKRPCLYLYAAATLPEYRGRGYFGEILKYIEQYMPEPVILVPGESALIGYYEKQGFHLWQKEKRLQWVCNFEKDGEEYSGLVDIVSEDIESRNIKSGNITLESLTPEKYFSLREAILSSQQQEALLPTSDLNVTGYICWSKPFIEYICRENEFCGGKIAGFFLGEQQYIMMYREEQGKYKILELLPQDRVKEVSELFSAEICLQPMVMADSKWKVPDGEGYFNLTMG